MCLVQKSFHHKEYDGIVNFFNNIPSHSFAEFISAYGSIYESWGSPLTVVNYSITGNESTYQFASENDENKANITLKFVYPIFFTHYTLKTRSDGFDENILNSWVVEGSLDGNDFKQADKQDNNDILGSKISETFKCQSPMIANVVRIRMTKATKYPIDDRPEKWHLHLSRVEFYGSIFISPDLMCPRLTCRISDYRQLSVSALCFITFIIR